MSPRRSFILIAMLLVVGAALLVVTTIVFMAQADAAGAAGVRERTQSRLLAWSGIQAVSTRLDEQRRRIFDGEQPELDEEYVIYEDGQREGVVRLLPVTASGALLAPEAGRLDLNNVTGAALAATGLVEQMLADRIIAYRDEKLNGAFESVAELLHVPGVTGELLYGPLDEIALLDDAAGVESDLGTRMMGRLEGDAPRGLADVVTVYAVEPALQRSGDLQININVPWSEELGRRVDRRFGDGASEVLKRVMDEGTTFDSDAVIFRVMRSLGTEPEDWPDIVDALTTDTDDLHFGRLDINSAPYEALVALEGLEPEQASEIVRARDALSADRLATIAWPAIEGIVGAEAYETLGGRITTRSWTYRLRLAAGERDREAADPDAETGAAGLENLVIYEVVIDLTDPQPRVAYVRDVTLLQIGAALLAARSEATDDPAAEIDEFTRDAPRSEPVAPGAGDSGDSGGARRGGSWGTGASAGSGESGGADPGEANDASEDGARTPSGPKSEDGRAPMGPGVRRERVGRWRSGRADRGPDLGSSG